HRTAVAARDVLENAKVDMPTATQVRGNRDVAVRPAAFAVGERARCVLGDVKLPDDRGVALRRDERRLVLRKPARGRLHVRTVAVRDRAALRIEVDVL